MDNKEIGALTGLRGVAALWVFLFHVGDSLRGGSHELVSWLDLLGRAGYLGVDIFFVLSGFVLALNYADSRVHRTASQYGLFLWKRIARVYPVHIAALVLLIILVLSFQIADRAFIADDRLSIGGLIATLTLTHAWDMPMNKTWNTVSWSISCEWAAYIAFPVLAAIAMRLRSARFIVGLIVLLFTAFWATIHFGAYGGTMAYGMPRIAVEFSAGVLLYRLWVLRGQESARYGDYLALSSLITMIIGGNIVATIAGWRTPLPYAPILACGIVYGLAIGRGQLTRALSSATALFAGRISYAFYMVHMLLLGAGIGILRAHSAGHVDGAVVMTIIASFAAIVIAATYLYYRVETPARRVMVGLPSILLSSRRAPAAEAG